MLVRREPRGPGGPPENSRVDHGAVIDERVDDCQIALLERRDESLRRMLRESDIVDRLEPVPVDRPRIVPAREEPPDRLGTPFSRREMQAVGAEVARRVRGSAPNDTWLDDEIAFDGRLSGLELTDLALQPFPTWVCAARYGARYSPAAEVDLDGPEAGLDEKQLHRATVGDDPVLDDDLSPIASQLIRLVLRVTALERHQA
jgi:hypothetical protein